MGGDCVKRALEGRGQDLVLPPCNTWAPQGQQVGYSAAGHSKAPEAKGPGGWMPPNVGFGEKLGHRTTPASVGRATVHLVSQGRGKDSIECRIRGVRARVLTLASVARILPCL